MRYFLMFMVVSEILLAVGMLVIMGFEIYFNEHIGEIIMSFVLAMGFCIYAWGANLFLVDFEGGWTK